MNENDASAIARFTATWLQILSHRYETDTRKSDVDVAAEAAELGQITFEFYKGKMR